MSTWDAFLCIHLSITVQQIPSKCSGLKHHLIISDGLCGPGSWAGRKRVNMSLLCNVLRDAGCAAPMGGLKDWRGL